MLTALPNHPVPLVFTVSLSLLDFVLVFQFPVSIFHVVTGQAF